MLIHESFAQEFLKNGTIDSSKIDSINQRKLFCKSLLIAMITDTTNGQRVSRHSLPDPMFFIFSHRTFFKNNFSQPASGTFGFAPTHKANPSQSQKSHFFAYADKHIKELDNKMLKRNVQYIAHFISINTTFDTLNYLTAGATL